MADRITVRQRATWLLAAGGALLGAWLVRRQGTWVEAHHLLEAPNVNVVAGMCVILALVALLATARPQATAWIGPVAATLRLGLALVLLGAWQGEARELWAALAVWIAFRDASVGLSAPRPFVPVAVALAFAVALHAFAQSAVTARTILVGIVCALAASAATREPTDPRPAE